MASNIMMWGYYNNWGEMAPFGFAFGIAGLIFMILWWALIILAIVYLARWVIRQSSTFYKEKSPVDILKERYAKGEISREEFEKMKKDLSQ